MGKRSAPPAEPEPDRRGLGAPARQAARDGARAAPPPVASVRFKRQASAAGGWRRRPNRIGAAARWRRSHAPVLQAPQAFPRAGARAWACSTGCDLEPGPCRPPCVPGFLCGCILPKASGLRLACGSLSAAGARASERAVARLFAQGVESGR